MGSFWTDPKVSPKQNFKFVVYISGLEDSAIVWYAKKATKPKPEISKAEHKYLGHTFKFPGMVTWQPRSIVTGKLQI